MPFLSGGNYLNVVRLELRIRCYDGNPFALGLGHEKAIKRVAMMERQVQHGPQTDLSAPHFETNQQPYMRMCLNPLSGASRRDPNKRKLFALKSRPLAALILDQYAMA